MPGAKIEVAFEHSYSKSESRCRVIAQRRERRAASGKKLNFRPKKSPPARPVSVTWMDTRNKKPSPPAGRVPQGGSHSKYPHHPTRQKLLVFDIRGYKPKNTLHQSCSPQSVTGTRFSSQDNRLDASRDMRPRKNRAQSHSRLARLPQGGIGVSGNALNERSQVRIPPPIFLHIFFSFCPFKLKFSQDPSVARVGMKR